MAKKLGETASATVESDGGVRLALNKEFVWEERGKLETYFTADESEALLRYLMQQRADIVADVISTALWRR
jgi:hypothetical protein